MPPPHMHLPPSLKHAWTSFSCPTCTPELYAAFTADVPSTMPDDTTEAVCPICLDAVTVKGGRIRNHNEDTVVCRASGLSPAVAEHLLDALMRGIDIIRFVREARAAGRVPRDGVQTSNGVGDVAYRLTQLRQSAAMTPLELSERIGCRPQSIYVWEVGQPPRLDSAVKWAAALGQTLVVGGSPMMSATATAHWLGQRRIAAGTPVRELAEVMGITDDTLRRWEQGKTSAKMTLLDLTDWVAAMDMTVELCEAA